LVNSHGFASCRLTKNNHSELSILSTNPPAVRAPSARPPADWQLELRDAVRDPAALCAALDLPPSLAVATGGAGAFPLLVPASYLSRIRPGDPRDPLLVQVWPAAAEDARAAGFVDDPVDDAAAVVEAGLLHKYAGRALLVATGACAIHCRYCFRRHFPYDETPPSDAAWGAAIDAIERDASIHEVILSGGDPLTVNDRRLAALVERLAEVPHLTRLRIHTRLPVVIPSRVTEELVQTLASSRLTPIVVIHANHARELDAAFAAAVDRLRRAGVMLLNQAVLLRSVNDSADAQCDLSLRLIDVGVTPYYLHQLDRVRGAAHFDVPIDRAQEIIAEIRRRLPGYAVPRYVQERPGAEHKVVLA
jgi:L-lysine 2,3-aminomutase